MNQDVNVPRGFMYDDDERKIGFKLTFEEK